MDRIAPKRLRRRGSLWKCDDARADGIYPIKVKEVDLARFGRGTYVITFTSQEGTCYEQVVVE